MDLKKESILLLDKAIVDKRKIRVSYKNNLLEHYLDICGQRQEYLVHYNYGCEDIKSSEELVEGHFEGVYAIRRKLLFVNKEDEGKEGAYLGRIAIDKASNISILQEAHKTTITADYIILTIHHLEETW